MDEADWRGFVPFRERRVNSRDDCKMLIFHEQVFLESVKRWLDTVGWNGMMRI
jgi:hypothetical protein